MERGVRCRLCVHLVYLADHLKRNHIVLPASTLPCASNTSQPPLLPLMCVCANVGT